MCAVKLNLFKYKREDRFWAWAIIFICLLLINCQGKQVPSATIVEHMLPTYYKIELITKLDTLNISLNQSLYNEIKSFNYFTHNYTPFLSFYDQKSESVALYNFKSMQLVKVIPIKKALKKKNLFHASVYTFNFDSIFVAEYADLYRIDSGNNIKEKNHFIGEKQSMAYFATPLPVVVHDGQVYMGVRSWVNENRLKDIRRWKLLYAFDLQNKKQELHYQLSDIYRKGLYGKRFMEYNYCFNDKGRFVFNFPADTNIYETDLNDYHVGYYAKSRYQQGNIEPVSKEALERDEGRKEYTLRDYYGPIYFDPYKKRYLRFVKQKVSKEAYESKSYDRKISVIVLNENFQIIGEFPFKKDYDYETLFFTPDGGIYARVNPKDENALHFVRLAWSDAPPDTNHLTQK
jgi:hypothetical protein